MIKLKKNNKGTTATAQPATLIPLLLALGGLALAIIPIWFALYGTGTDRYRSDLTTAYLSQQTSALNQSMRLLDADLARLAANPQLQVALQQNDDVALQRLLRSPLALNLALHVNAVGQAQVTDHPSAPLTFAALDMIRRVERNMPVSMEVHPVSGKWLLYAAKPLRASENAPIGGTLVAVFELQRLINSMPVLPTDSGQVSLVQSFPGGPEQILYQQGQGFGNAQSMGTDNPAWRLDFSPGPLLSAGLVNPLLPMSAILLVLAGLIAGLLWLQRSWARSLKSDAEVLLQLTQGHKVAGLQLGELEPLAQRVMQLATSKGQKSPPSPEREGKNNPQKPATEEVPADPIFQSHDILDIDIIDGDDDAFGMGAADSPSAPGLNVPAEIFRAYDIRGVVGKTLTADNVYWIGRAIGSASLEADEAKVAVARDGRLSGPELVEALIRGLIDSGCHVTDLGMVPTPVLYYATHTSEATSGVMLTGSHNPAEYNGLKIVIAGETLAEQRIQDLYKRILNHDFSQGAGSRQQLDLLNAYRQQITDDVVLVRPLKVVIDCGNGVAGVIAQQLIADLGCEVTPLFCEVDGNFPNHHPDPGNPDNLKDLIAEVQRQGADVGIAFDGDGDRLGVVTAKGELIYSDRLMMLFAEDIVTRHPGADIVFDVKCSRRLPALISRMGGRPLMWKSGHSLIKAKMLETNALLAGEMSGHIFFKERWFGFDDGLYSACRLLELMSIVAQNVDESAQVFDKYPAGIVTPEINLPSTETRKFEIIEALKKNASWGQGKVTTLDGLRVDYANGWGLVRASNTSPVLVLRFEADSEDELNSIKQIFRDQLAAAASDLTLIF
ncbi:MAG: phosphomannomutase/phosphoglucomutase [Gammaproteobacteria bacterium HGW-Gammaproteobacteria-11]|nr:MAG: phosphomannomutase/phosphoglucomutase [Gammaproteobacteria bacterium HGW-Gammaproteobacteria-11]